MRDWLPRIGRRYEAATLDLDEPFVRDVPDPSGVLLRIRPYPAERDLARTVELFRAIHSVTTNWRGRNTSDRFSFELRFHEGRLSFFLYAATSSLAETIRRQLAAVAPESEVSPVETGPALPAIDPDDAVAGATVTLAKSAAYPIRQHDIEGFETDPYTELTSEMVTSDDCTVVVQFVCKPAKRSWATGGVRSSGVAEIAHGRRQGRLVGWLDPTIRSPGTTDERIADVIERQRTRPAYHVTIRVAAWAPDGTEAIARTSNVAGMFGRRYDGLSEQTLVDVPVWSRVRARQPTNLRRHVTKLADRELTDQGTILTVDELAGLAHLPGTDVTTPTIDWRAVRSGAPIAPEAARPADGARDDGVSGTSRRNGGTDAR